MPYLRGNIVKFNFGPWMEIFGDPNCHVRESPQRVHEIDK
jgi:hypothetical protein